MPWQLRALPLPAQWTPRLSHNRDGSGPRLSYDRDGSGRSACRGSQRSALVPCGSAPAWAMASAVLWLGNGGLPLATAIGLTLTTAVSLPRSPQLLLAGLLAAVVAVLVLCLACLRLPRQRPPHPASALTRLQLFIIAVVLAGVHT